MEDPNLPNNSNRDPEKGISVNNININEEDELNNRFEITDKIINEILEDKERHLDVSNLPANYDKAVCHLKATQFYMKEHFDNLESIEFCDDCLNPIPLNDSAKKYPFCSDIKVLTELGTGVFLYFFFMRFVFIMCFLLFGVVSIAEIIVARRYNDEMTNICLVYPDISDSVYYKSNLTDICSTFNSDTDNDWLYSMNFENLRNYKKLINTDDLLIEKDKTFNVNLMNFICMIVMFIMNGVFIIILNNLESEADYKIITPEDFTLMISDIPNDFDDYEQMRIQVLELHTIQPIEINVTYRISGYIKKKEEFKVLKKQLRMMHNNDLKMMKTGCCGKMITKEEVARKILEIDCELNEMIDTFEDADKTRSLFNGTVFATFKDISDYDAYRSFFPYSMITRMLTYIKLQFCGCCYNERENKYLRKKVSLTVDNAPEPSDIKWENLEISNYDRKIRIMYITIGVFLVLCVSFGALLGISYIQKQFNFDNQAGKYLVSLLFALVTNLFNWIITKVMLKLTIYERNVSHTSYLLSFSLKLLIFTFINSAPLTIAANALAGNWDNKQVLVNNVFFIFLTNSISSPLMYLVNPWYWYRAYLRNSYAKKVEETNKKIFDQTQAELNT